MFSTFNIFGTYFETTIRILHICRNIRKNRLNWKDMAQTLYILRNIYV
jgi:hypothetical protein